jgi:OFA family oxalate/formate antiporter-like MFS transporter
MNLSMGVNYSWSIFKKFLVEEQAWSNVEASWPYSLYALIFSFSMTLGGRLQDRFGPRPVATAGALGAGAGYLACSLADSFGPLLAAYGLAALGNSLCHATTVPTANKWFPPERRGLVTGLVIGAVSMASFVMAPLAAWLIGGYGLSRTFLVLGLGIALFLLFLARFMDNPPPGASAGGGLRPSAGPSLGLRDYTWREMLGARRFYQLWLVFVISCSAGLMIIGHLVTIAKHQAGWELGYYVVMALAVFNTLGRLAAGGLSDRCGRLAVIFAVLFLQMVNMACFGRYLSPGALLAGAGLTGFCYGAGMALFPLISVEFYGLKNAGLNYGLLYTGMGVAGIFGPLLAAWSMDETASYGPAYHLVAGLLALALLLVWRLSRPGGKNVRFI